jgi:VanZ family protein
MTLPGQRNWRPVAFAWLPVLAWCALIFWLSAMPSPEFSQDATWDVMIKKAGHVGIFGVLAVLVWRALTASTRLAWSRPLAVVLVAGYAATDELHQVFTSGRHPAITDVMIDTTGAVIAVLVVGFVLRRLQRRQPA